MGALDRFLEWFSLLTFKRHYEIVRNLQSEQAFKIDEEKNRQVFDAKQRATWLVSDQPVGISEAIAQSLRADVALRIKNPPTDEQWEMILSDHPATYVIAGAGSGKSTSLVFRVLALNLYRGIDRSQISVFTFTNASRADFIQKLIDRMQQWGVTLNETDAKTMVRTFHSMIFKIARTTINPDIKMLEFLDWEKRGPIADIDIDNLLEISEFEQPTHNRDEILRFAYEKAFQEDVDFNELIRSLYRQHLYLLSRSEAVDSLKWIAKNDESQTWVLHKEWCDLAPTLWPLGGIETSILPFPVSDIQLWSNGYAPSLEAHIFLGCDKHNKNSPHSNSKRKLLACSSDKPFIWINSIEDLTKLQATLAWFNDDDKRASVPNFYLKAPGDSKEKYILDTFWEFAQFVHGLGLSVTSIQNDVINNKKLTPFDQLYTQALSRFWPYFEAELRKRDIWTFDQLFSHFSEDNPENIKKIPHRDLLAMRHLLIDEFQDISPQIVKWIRGCQRELVRREQPGTLMCVGDDWQSIYGWRGSSPEYFVKFRMYFPAKNHLKILLEANFRSSDHIIRCAESVIHGVPGMESKKGQAAGKYAETQTPVYLYFTNKDDGAGELPYHDIADLIIKEIARTKPDALHPMLVLSRTHNINNILKKKLSGIDCKVIRFMTIHGSKGLESRTVFLLGDNAYWGKNEMRNILFNKAGLGNYDDSQRAEAFRLAYVGITRAMEHCYWFGTKFENGAMTKIPQNAQFAKVKSKVQKQC